MKQNKEGSVTLSTFTPPKIKKVIAFIDAQNLYRDIKNCFGYHWPNFDPIKISKKFGIREYNDRELLQVRLYTGIPLKEKNRRWHSFWVNKLKEHSNNKIFYSYTRNLAYHLEKVEYVDEHTGKKRKELIEISREKGIDVRIALDIVDLAYKDRYDIAVIFSRDNDLSEAVKDLKEIRNSVLKRWILIETPFPSANLFSVKEQTGIYDTQWIPFTKYQYDSCIDPNDYRPSREVSPRIF